MRCPNCSRGDTGVIDSRPTGARVRRRRECKHCGERFTTREELAREFPKIVKRDKRREEYQSPKLRTSIGLALQKIDVSADRPEQLISDIEKLLLNIKEPEYPSLQLGIQVMQRLRELNHVAYVRYASVYLGFEDVSDFIRQVEALQDELARQQVNDEQLSLDL